MTTETQQPMTTSSNPSLPRMVNPNTYVMPTVMFMLAAMLVVVSIFLPYWTMTLHAPQYPKGLTVQLYVNRVAGDAKEIDGLNHYIGMPKMEEAAAFERSFAVIAIIALTLLLIAAIFIHNQWAALFALPVIAYPVVFLADLFYWLYSFGHNLDPAAPLSSSIKPFTPTLLGTGIVGQFKTTAMVDTGFYLAIVASGVILIGLWLHRAAYKPLMDAEKALKAQTAR